ncbi:MAG: hypothetical protein U0414_08935 [Polyangiaceae bacterium]
MRRLVERGGSEVELYQHLGFPDGFTDGDWLLAMEGSPPMELQYLRYGPPECEVVLKGGRVLGHPHEVPARELDRVEWDGVARPRTLHEYRAHVQRLAPSIPARSPLGQALRALRPADLPNRARGRGRLVDWWALSRESHHGDLAPTLERALARLGDVGSLRVAAELVGPGFARRALVRSGHWPPSRLGVTRDRIAAALPTGYPDRYSVHARLTGEYLGPLYHVRPIEGPDLREEERFAEEDRATSWPLLASGYSITGDGEIVRRARAGWVRLGAAIGGLLIRPPRAERRRPT